MQKSDSDLASVIVLRAVVRDDERLFVPLRSQFIAHLCQAPLFQVCGGKVTARSQSFTTKQYQLRQTFPSVSSDYNPRMIRILVCLRETNRAVSTNTHEQNHVKDLLQCRQPQHTTLKRGRTPQNTLCSFGQRTQ